MIKNITIKNYLGEVIILELTRPEITGLLIRSIEGLGPPNANINMTEYVTNDGALFNSSHVNSRQLVISFKLLGDEENGMTIEDCRLKLYRYFQIKQPVIFSIETDNRKCKTEGYVASVEPDIFSEDEGVTVTLDCPDAFFHSLSPYTYYFRNVDPKFKFPFSNNSLKQKLLLMGNVNLTKNRDVFYDGDGEVGIKIILKAMADVRGFGIYTGLVRNDAIEIDDDILEELTGNGILAGDEITISTIKGKRGVWLVRDKKRYNILNALKRPVKWMTINYGKNVISYYAEEGEDLINLYLEYDILYMGV